MGPGGQDTAGDPVCTHLQASLLAASILPVLLQRVPHPERGPCGRSPPHQPRHPRPAPALARLSTWPRVRCRVLWSLPRNSTALGVPGEPGLTEPAGRGGASAWTGDQDCTAWTESCTPAQKSLPQVSPRGCPLPCPSHTSPSHPGPRLPSRVTWVVGHALEGTVEVAEVGDEAQRVTPGHYRLSGHHRLEAQLPLRQLQRQGRGFQSPQALQL